MEIISRQDAIAKGLSWFFSGRPCGRGHIARNRVGGGCAICRSEDKKRRRAENPEKFAAEQRRGRIKNASKIAARERKHRADNPDYYRRKEWKAWGYPEPTRPQTELCECCSKPQTHKAMCLDHCHVTNKFRGWLCDGCNTSIGKLGDNIEGLQRAIDYLKRAE